jgi:hypothetical protein
MATHKAHIRGAIERVSRKRRLLKMEGVPGNALGFQAPVMPAMYKDNKVMPANAIEE